MRAVGGGRVGIITVSRAPFHSLPRRMVRDEDGAIGAVGDGIGVGGYIGWCRVVHVVDENGFVFIS